MDCSIYVLSSPVLYSVSLLTGYIIAKYKSEQQLQHLYEHNDKLQEENEDMQERISSYKLKLQEFINKANNLVDE
jgi:cell division protein FtsB